VRGVVLVVQEGVLEFMATKVRCKVVKNANEVQTEYEYLDKMTFKFFWELFRFPNKQNNI